MATYLSDAGGEPDQEKERADNMMAKTEKWHGAGLVGAGLVWALLGGGAAAQIANPVAVFDGLDKVTATITTFEVPINGVGRFGALTIVPRVCYTRPPTEPPKTTTFVEIDEQQLSGASKRIFTGWMFASSPGISGVEHPVYDVWLKACKTSSAEAAGGSAKKSP